MNNVSAIVIAVVVGLTACSSNDSGGAAGGDNGGGAGELPFFGGSGGESGGSGGANGGAGGAVGGSGGVAGAGGAAGGQGGSSGPVCSGTALQCVYMTSSECQLSNGCKPDSQCEGTAMDCFALYQSECYAQEGCYWSSASSSCAGSSKSCSSFSDPTACGSQMKCKWKTTCSGAVLCTSLDKAQCSQVPGCYQSADGPPKTHECSNMDQACTGSTTCCPGSSSGGTCVYNGHGAVCRPNCSVANDCASLCCRNGICGDLEQCNSTCAGPGTGCSTPSDCCAGATCLNLNNKGLCAVLCTSNSDCPGGCCAPTSSSKKVCVPSEMCQ
ncbi:MAG: hypothetical protein HY898_15545 [Deltaproteobacteria bacterium]|nr:hypothetical protein [Deltaproteobacteria bacterium]